MGSYQITIRFTTDRNLSQDELDLILGSCEAQVEEPADLAGNDMDVDVRIIESDILDHG